MHPSRQAELVMRFVNTLDLEDGTDELDSSPALVDWLAKAGLTTGHPQLDPGDHRLALDLRAGLREVLGIGAGTPADQALITAATSALAQLPVRVTMDLAEPLAHTPAESVRRALTELAIAWAHLVITGEALRIKRCAEHGCGWVFWDGSKNRSRRWCSMRVCGNRNKARAYAERHRADDS
ncbi:CGNR zinc finger domain-containing protein [Nocardia terpenica]|uniref:CGNR zinc finger domain-containing protein n=1 Tax=Nocardia terpenica TaxID=455432 RepID=UPI0018939627|nr:CGNR zinc finger domain-containing protein [Nocardia terpenica]MBF6064632.1 CGNR zinc finger domain-containing protein [Nocardia terpenica]MBF6106744.1 CGNR zinc finger domain-containing protein [Nocardia terpenica]MBF6114600.1 CGNR zinc finger domain-containing protein [Nocardia terpenica]MBF6121314.1 CGNR zinc finger domain-containing protein [Nocardia terpenica]MBF6153729.1 CGNR zinc finger domain-containing protein [Nocardia terpenica]